MDSDSNDVVPPPPPPPPPPPSQGVSPLEKINEVTMAQLSIAAKDRKLAALVAEEQRLSQELAVLTQQLNNARYKLNSEKRDVSQMYRNIREHLEAEELAYREACAIRQRITDKLPTEKESPPDQQSIDVVMASELPLSTSVESDVQAAIRIRKLRLPLDLL